MNRPTAMQRFALWRTRAVFALREYGEAWLRLDFTSMSKHDRARWAGARSMADLGELVVAWLHGEIQQTPGHCAPPCDETIPLIPALTAANRAGFVTDNSQRADGWDWQWEAYVSGFAADADLARLREAAAGTPLVITACRRRHHEHEHPTGGWTGCPRRDQNGFWCDRSPRVAKEIRAAWYVVITDPQPGRNSVLWPALETFAKTAPQAQEASTTS
jgi:hypothetical protein